LGRSWIFRKNAPPRLHWIDTLPPEMKKAITERHALLGMDREEVVAAIGKPDRKVRDARCPMVTIRKTGSTGIPRTKLFSCGLRVNASRPSSNIRNKINPAPRTGSNGLWSGVGYRRRRLVRRAPLPSVRIRLALSQIGWWQQILNTKFEPWLPLDSFDGCDKAFLCPCIAQRRFHELYAIL